MNTLGVVVGGTNTWAGVVRKGEPLGTIRLSTNGDNYDADFSRLVESLELLRTEHPSGRRLGVALAAQWDDVGTIVGSGNLPGYEGKNLFADLKHALGVNVYPLGDCQAEAWYAAFISGCTIFYLNAGTGIGAGYASIQGDVVEAKKTEIGHLPFDRSGRYPCGCGGMGHVEALLTHLERRFGVASVDLLTDKHWEEVIVDFAEVVRMVPNLTQDYVDIPVVLGGTVARQITGRADRFDQLRSLVSGLKAPTNPPVDIRDITNVEHVALRGATLFADQQYRLTHT